MIKFKKLATLGIIFGSAFIAACTPNIHNELVEIAPNKTAFLIKMDGDNVKEQNKFQSEEFLEANKIATRRITIEHKLVDLCQNCATGHQWVDVAAFRLIQIDRTPVTREWTSTSATGTSSKNQAFHVESNESIDFSIGANITANISEKDAAKFLYHYGGKQLEDVIDQDVRGFISSSLSQQFGSQSLDYGRKNKVDIFNKAFTSSKEYFSPYGITISRVGFTEGMTYTDSNIQKSINQKFEADMQTEIAKKTLEAAETNSKAKEAVKAQQDFELRKLEIELEKLKVQKWNGVNSTTIVEGGSHAGMNINVK